MDLSELKAQAHRELEARMKTLAHSHTEQVLKFIDAMESQARHADTEYARRVFLQELRACATEHLDGQ